MTRDDVVTRARSAIGKGCRYGLGKGGYLPDQPMPFGVATMMCDCSGLAAWSLGVSRKTDHPWYKDQNGGWLETTAIIRDCGTPFGMFDRVLPGLALPGDLYVYGDRRNGERWRQGHVGIISEVDGSGPSRAVHCSSGNFRDTGDAIQETGVAIWLRAGGIVARYAGLA